MLSLALVLTAVLSVPSAPSTQPHPLVGAWSITFSGGMRVENGVPTPIMVEGKLTVELKGDSLVAVLASEPPPGMPKRPDARMAALATSGEVTFVQESQAQLMSNGESRNVTVWSTWKLAVSGDELRGTVDRRLEGVEAGGPMSGPQPVKGSRITG